MTTNSLALRRTTDNYEEQLQQRQAKPVTTNSLESVSLRSSAINPNSANSNRSLTQWRPNRVSPQFTVPKCALIRPNPGPFAPSFPMNPHRMIAFYPPRAQLQFHRTRPPPDVSNQTLVAVNSNPKQAMVPINPAFRGQLTSRFGGQWSQPFTQMHYHHQAELVANLERTGKLVARQTLHNIAPVEYVERVRKLSRPILDNKKALKQRLKDKLHTAEDKPKPRKRRPYFLMSTVVALFSLVMFTVQDTVTQEGINFVMSELKPGSILTKNWREKTVVFMERLSFKFVAEDSKSLDTKMHMINYPIFIVVLFLKSVLETFYLGFIGPIVYNSVVVALRATGEGLIDHTTARLLIEGKPIPILSYLGLLLKPIRAAGVPIPEWFGSQGLYLTNHSFGFVSTIGSGEVGPYEVFTRTEHSHLVGDIFTFQGKSEFPTWNSPCNFMAGGDGMFWRRPVQSELLTLYISVMCRMVPFVRAYDHVFQGAQVVRYLLDPQMYNQSLARNQCFCHSSRTKRQCNGWHDISPCLGWLPVGISHPHFYQSPNLLRKVIGLTPNEDEHQGFLDMDPLIGAPVNARVGVQVVFDVRPVPLVPSMSSLPTLPFPIGWFKVHAGAYGGLGVLLFVGSNAVRYGSYAWLVGGLGFATFLFYRGNRQRKQPTKVDR